MPSSNPQEPDQFQEWTERFEKSLDARGIRDRFRKLTDLGVNPRTLVRILHDLAEVHHDLDRPPHKRRRPGIRERKLRSLKNTVIKAAKIVHRATVLAKEMSELNRECFIDSVPPEWLAKQVETVGTGITQENLLLVKQLPSDLRTYVEVLRAKVLPVYRRRGSMKREYGSDDYLLALLDSYIRRVTRDRRPHHEDVAELLEAAVGVSAKDGDAPGRTLTAGAIAMTVKRLRERDRRVIEIVERHVSAYIANGNGGSPPPPGESTPSQPSS